MPLKSFPPSSSQVPGAERGSAGGGRGGAEEAGAHSGQLLPQHCRLQAEAAAVAGSPGQLQRGTAVDRDPVSLSKSQPLRFHHRFGLRGTESHPPIRTQSICGAFAAPQQTAAIQVSVRVNTKCSVGAFQKRPKIVKT